MRRIDLAFDETIVVPIPEEEDVDSWAESTSARLRQAHGLSVESAGLVQNGLRAAHRSASDAPGVLLALFAAPTLALSLLRITVVERELTPDERSAFLRPASAIRPQVWLTPETSVGVGVSSTVLVDPSTGESAVRWMFMPRGATVLAVLGPVASMSVLPLGAIAEQVLESMRIDGLGAETATDFVPAELVAGPDTEGRTWQS